ncbi:hypothetical protein C8R47DRAFT_1078539 [Mycena vitilis]|nr:hypothetical protein C8R47DRAFT_1078539 [Mycena vitilis]
MSRALGNGQAVLWGNTWGDMISVTVREIARNREAMPFSSGEVNGGESGITASLPAQRALGGRWRLGGTRLRHASLGRVCQCAIVRDLLAKPRDEALRRTAGGWAGHHGREKGAGGRQRAAVQMKYCGTSRRRGGIGGDEDPWRCALSSYMARKTIADDAREEHKVDTQATADGHELGPDDGVRDAVLAEEKSAAILRRGNAAPHRGDRCTILLHSPAPRRKAFTSASAAAGASAPALRAPAFEPDKHARGRKRRSYTMQRTNPRAGTRPAERSFPASFRPHIRPVTAQNGGRPAAPKASPVSSPIHYVLAQGGRRGVDSPPTHIARGRRRAARERRRAGASEEGSSEGCVLVLEPRAATIHGDEEEPDIHMSISLTCRDPPRSPLRFHEPAVYGACARPPLRTGSSDPTSVAGGRWSSGGIRVGEDGLLEGRSAERRRGYNREMDRAGGIDT